MNADPAAQRRLLDLAAVDAELTRAAHRRRSLPELAEIEQADKSLRAGRDSLVAAETAASDLDRDIRKLEAEIDQVRARGERDRGLLDSGSISSGKQLEDLQHELDRNRIACGRALWRIRNHRGRSVRHAIGSPVLANPNLPS